VRDEVLQDALARDKMTAPKRKGLADVVDALKDIKDELFELRGLAIEALELKSGFEGTRRTLQHVSGCDTSQIITCLFPEHAANPCGRKASDDDES
jgi:hypothetical protein